MPTRRALLWICLVPLLLLSGCIGAVYEATPVVPQVVTPTPIVAFELTPAATPTEPGPVVTPTSALPPSLYLQPSVINLTVGGTATIKVWVDGAQRLNGILLEMSFNPNYARVDDANPEAEGIQIAPGEMPVPAAVAHNEVTVGEEGRVVYQAAQEPGTGTDGAGVVASIVLRGVAEGGSPLRFENVVAYGPEGNELEITPLSDGLVTVVAEEGASAPTAEPSAAATAQPTVTPAEGAAAEATSTPTPSPLPSPVAGGGIYYVVQPGENLFRIGLAFGTTAQAIGAASNIPDPNQVQAGAMVLIPVAPPQGGYGYYVQRKDTVYSIARRFGMTLDQLVALNGIGADYHIETAQILVVTP